MMEIKNREYFAFCWYPKRFAPRVIFVSVNNVGKEIKKEIEHLVKIGPFIQTIASKIFEQKKEQSRYATFSNSGYLLNNGDEDQTETTSNLLNNWLEYVNCENSMCVKEPFKDSIWYYITDENRLLNPKELYEYILKLESIKNKPLKIVNCVMLSERSIEKDIEKWIRFFFSKATSCSVKECENKIKETFELVSVNIAKKTNHNHGYGFAEITDKNQFLQLNKKKFQLDEETFVSFDKG